MTNHTDNNQFTPKSSTTWPKSATKMPTFKVCVRLCVLYV